MTKELYTSIIQNKLFFELFIIVISYVVYWVIMLKLSFCIASYNIKVKTLLPLIGVMVLYSFYIKQFLPAVFAGIGMLVLNILILIHIGKVKLIKSLWAAFVTNLSTGLGDAFILGPLTTNQSINYFIFNTPLGNVLGTIAETVFPAFLLFVIIRFKISLIPHIKKKPDRIDIMGITTLIFMFFIVFFFAIDLYSNIINPRYPYLILIMLLIASIGIIFGFVDIKRSLKKRYESQIMDLNEKYEIQIIDLNNKISDLKEKLQSSNCDPSKVFEAIGDVAIALEEYTQAFKIQLEINQSEPNKTIDQVIDRAVSSIHDLTVLRSELKKELMKNKEKEKGKLVEIKRKPVQ
jgi:hypothetical protein